MTRPLNLENAVIGFRNFEGREGQFNKSGDRSFAVFLNRQYAEELAEEGWNIKFPKDNGSPDPDDNGRDPYLQVSVAFDYYPPNVFLVSGDRPQRLHEDEIGMLDWAEISTVDLVIRPYEWQVSGKSGIKAYLKAGYFTIETDAFAKKYGV